ncbi:GNAT family N-acetyltransferase [Pseudomonadota bacterium]
MLIEAIDPGRALHLIEELDAYQASLYPPESNHLEPLEALRSERMIFLGAVEDEEVLAIGSVKLCEGYGEIKRLYVPHPQRGKGLAKKIMVELERLLADRELAWARLETGIHQSEAIGLYEALGYRMCEPFGDYLPDPLSLFMEKKL